MVLLAYFVAKVMDYYYIYVIIIYWPHQITSWVGRS